RGRGAGSKAGTLGPQPRLSGRSARDRARADRRDQRRQRALRLASLDRSNPHQAADSAIDSAGDWRRSGIPSALVGALALHTYGYSRATNDVDLLVGADAQDRLIAFLEQRGFETLHRSSGYSNHLHADPAFGRLDVVYVDADARRGIFAEARQVL